MLLWADNFRAVFWVAAIPGLMAVAPHVVWSRFWGHPSNPPAELLIDGDEDHKLFHTQSILDLQVTRLG